MKKRSELVIAPQGGGGGSGNAPIFDAVIEETEERIKITMAEKDRNAIYHNKYPIIGIHIVEEGEEEERGNEFTLYFKLRQNFIDENSLAYDLWDGDKEAISHIAIWFVWDGDDAKANVKFREYAVGGATKGIINLTNNENDEWTQAQIQDVFENKYDVVEVVSSNQEKTILYKIRSTDVVIYWSYIMQQGITAYGFMSDGNGGYSMQTMINPWGVQTMNVDGDLVINQDQDTLEEIYEKQPDILYVDAGNQGTQNYRKQVAVGDTLTYSCLISDYLTEVTFTEDRNNHTYSISIKQYNLSSLVVI